MNKIKENDILIAISSYGSAHIKISDIFKVIAVRENTNGIKVAVKLKPIKTMSVNDEFDKELFYSTIGLQKIYEPKLLMLDFLRNGKKYI